MEGDVGKGVGGGRGWGDNEKEKREERGEKGGEEVHDVSVECDSANCRLIFRVQYGIMAAVAVLYIL